MSRLWPFRNQIWSDLLPQVQSSSPEELHRSGLFHVVEHVGLYKKVTVFQVNYISTTQLQGGRRKSPETR